MEDNPAIVAYGDAHVRGAVYTLDIFRNTSSLDVYLTIADGGGFDAVGIQSNTPLKTNRVYHTVATYDGMQLTLYLDGALDNQQTVVQTPTPIAGYSTPGLSLGADPQYTGRPAFDGTIESVAIYDKALSAARVAAHFEAAKH